MSCVLEAGKKGRGVDRYSNVCVYVCQHVCVLMLVCLLVCVHVSSVPLFLCASRALCICILCVALGWQKQVKMSLSALFLVGLPPSQHGSFQRPPNPANLDHNTLKVALLNG